MEYVLLIGVILLLVLILMRERGAIGLMQTVYELIAGMVSWPFL